MAKKPKIQETPQLETPHGEASADAGGQGAEDRPILYARMAASPEWAAYRAIHACEGKSGMRRFFDISTLAEVLREQAAAVHRNDLAQVEAMLANQATTLQTLFVSLVEKAMDAECLPQFEAFMRMAPRSQAQCRATLETLAAVKRPQPVTFVRQANVAHGPQQVNDGTGSLSPAQKTENAPNELLPAQTAG